MVNEPLGDHKLELGAMDAAREIESPAATERIPDGRMVNNQSGGSKILLTLLDLKFTLGYRSSSFGAGPTWATAMGCARRSAIKGVDVCEPT